MDLEKKFIEMRNKISKNIESIQTDEEKKQFAEKYGFSAEEVETVIRKHKEWREAVKASDGVKRSSSNSMSGVDYSSDLDYTKQEVRRTNYQFMDSIKKQSFKSIVSEISPEEITPELVETLKQNGYDGKSGHPVLQSYFQMYCRVQEADSRSKNAESKVYSLERALEDRDDEIKALRSREDLLQNTIEKQSEYIAKIKDRLQLMSTKLLGLQEQLRPKSLIDKIKGFFSRKKVQGLPESAQECRYIKSQSEAAIGECDMSEKWREQNKPLSVDELKKQNARSRLKSKSKENVIETYFEEEPGWEIGK